MKPSNTMYKKDVVIKYQKKKKIGWHRLKPEYNLRILGTLDEAMRTIGKGGWTYKT